MDTGQKAKALAKEIRGVVTSGVVLPREATSHTREEVLNEIEKRIAAEAQSALDDAYAAGKADGIKESQAEKRRVFEAGKAEGRKEAEGQT